MPNDHDNKPLSYRILDIRQRLHISQKELGRYLGVSEGAIANCEQGKTKTPIARTMDKIKELERQIKQGDLVDIVRSKIKLCFYHRLPK